MNLYYTANTTKAQVLSSYFFIFLLFGLLLLVPVAAAGLGVVLIALHRASLLSEVLLQAVVWTADRKTMQILKILLDKRLPRW